MALSGPQWLATKTVWLRPADPGCRPAPYRPDRSPASVQTFGQQAVAQVGPWELRAGAAPARAPIDRHHNPLLHRLCYRCRGGALPAPSARPGCGLELTPPPEMQMSALARPVGLPVQDWPRMDQERLAAAFAELDIFEDQGPAADWSAATRRQQVYS